MPTEEMAEPSAESVPRKKKVQPRGHATIFGTWCKGCGICIEFCPQNVFEANGQGRPAVVHPERCTACHWCDTHCPDMAITVRRLDQEEVQELEELAQLAVEGVLPAGGAL